LDDFPNRRRDYYMEIAAEFKPGSPLFRPLAPPRPA
jgi:hypothetical protein